MTPFLKSNLHSNLDEEMEVEERRLLRVTVLASCPPPMLSRIQLTRQFPPIYIISQYLKIET